MARQVHPLAQADASMTASILTVARDKKRSGKQS
jgi:hypothetical protein